MTSRLSGLRWVGVAALLAGATTGAGCTCGGGDSQGVGGSTPFAADAGTLAFVTDPSPIEGVLTGIVFEGSPAKRLGGVTLRVNGAAYAALVDGTFTIKMPIGRAVVTAELDGYVPWRAELAIGSQPHPLQIDLRAAGALQKVAAAAWTDIGGGASISTEQGTASVRATVLSAASLTNRGGVLPAIRDINFIDGDPWGIIGVVHVSAPAAWTSRLYVKVPVPAGVTAAGVFAAQRGKDGARETPHDTDDHTDTSVTVAVDPPDGADLERSVDLVLKNEIDDATPAVGTVVQVDDGVLIGAGAAKAPDLGERFAGDALTLTVPAGLSVTLQDVNGTDFTVEASAETPTLVRLEPGVPSGLRARYLGDAVSGAIGEAEGSISVLVKAALDGGGTIPEIVDAADVHVGHEGTAFTITGNACPGSAARMTRVEVQEGSVQLVTKAGAIDLGLGQGPSARACPLCAEPNAPACCSPDTCQGCCSASDACIETGSENACGLGGTLCEICDAEIPCDQSSCKACGGYRQPCCMATECSPVVDDQSVVHNQTCNPQTLKCCFVKGAPWLLDATDCCVGTEQNGLCD